MIPIARPEISKQAKERVLEVLDSGMLAAGKYVKEFEEKFSDFIGAIYGTATSNGTTALDIALKAAGVGEGDLVLTTPFTFIASSNAILYSGARPVFVDVDRNTFNIDPEQIRAKLEKNPEISALLIVHLYGLACDMEEIMKLVREYELTLIEDCAQAHGAEYAGRKVGTSGDAAIFSFYPTKNMTTGEGGMVLTSDEEINKRAHLLVDHGQSERYYHDILGYNYRMTDIAAVIGLDQLERISEFNRKRCENAAYFIQELSDLEWLETPFVPENCLHVYHQFTVKVEERDRFAEYLKENGIGYGIHYPVPVYRQPVYQKRGYQGLELPVTEELSRKVISLPVHPSLTRAEKEEIVRVIRSFL